MDEPVGQAITHFEEDDNNMIPRKPHAFLATLLLLLVAIVLVPLSSTVAQGAGTLTLNLATCRVPGSASSISVYERFDPAASEWECEVSSWPRAGEFTLNGVAPDGGDGSTVLIWSTLTPGESYLLEEVGGAGVFDAGYGFTYPESDAYALWAVLYLHFTPDNGDDETGSVPDNGPTGDESSSELDLRVDQDAETGGTSAEEAAAADEGSVSALPATGVGSTTSMPAHSSWLLAGVTAIIAVVVILGIARRSSG
jgi:hypothetical protein